MVNNQPETEPNCFHHDEDKKSMIQLFRSYNCGCMSSSSFEGSVVSFLLNRFSINVPGELLLDSR